MCPKLKNVTSAKFQIKTTENIIRLNETDGIMGGGQTGFWLSLCCDERMHHAPFDSCFPQTSETVAQISAGSKLKYVKEIAFSI